MQALYYVRDEDSFTLAKYLASARTDRRIIRQYGPALVGWRRTLQHLIRSMLKGETYRVLTMLHQEGRLIHRRYVDISTEDHHSAARAIDAILRTEVPGLSRPVPDRVPA